MHISFTDRVRIHRAVAAAAAVAVVIHRIVRGGAEVENRAAAAVVDPAIQDTQDILNIQDHVRDLILVRMPDIAVDNQIKRRRRKKEVSATIFTSLPHFLPKKHMEVCISSLFVSQ